MTINLSHSRSVISGAEDPLTRAPGNEAPSLRSSAFNNDVSFFLRHDNEMMKKE